MSVNHCKYLVVGGGVSGLMFANLVKNDDFILLEKESELGGFCRTIYQDGFIWDYAGHFFHFANEEIKSFFKSKIADDAFVLKDKVTKIFYQDSVVDFPFQTNIHQLEKEEFIECLYDLYFREEKEVYDSFLDMLYGKFGKSITEKFLKPYNEKLYACDLNSLDTDAMGRFFPYANLEQIIRNFKQQYQGSYNSTFLYPKKGAKVFVDALAQDLPENNVFLNEQVVSIDAKAKIAVTTHRRISYDYLINSMPLNRFLSTINDIDYQHFVDRLSWNKVLVFNLGFDKMSTYDEVHWAYFPEKKYNFYRVGFYNNILDDERLSLYVEIGYGPNDDINVEAQLAATLAGLKDAGIITDHLLLSSCHIVMDPAYVHVNSELSGVKDEVKSDLESMGIYSIGRYGDWKYCSIEDSMLDAISVAKKIA
ncbi:protoporphyrinogen/coproporphyrinogen oxidase [Aeromonas simiae]|uniref:protoporphyrinogen/coproporphyrinogen oxidase n=1 Tax=Aeromonas simiae TaxID=218936 RepID=UPI00266BC119|nr:FAD-dependent oxidoreductase [Aeromonas simiae]MDO2951797.1 FAD-dependent oxidoreductase [Aeromonas simiae]